MASMNASNTAGPAEATLPPRLQPGEATQVSIKTFPVADWLAAGVIVVTAWWYVRVSRGQTFVFDDWNVAVRPGSLSDLLEPHNGHLSVVPLAIYRVLLGTFGLETFTPYRLLAISSLLALGIALFLFTRSRVGTPIALTVAVSVLWLPTTSLTPFLANFHLALVCAVVCAAAMPAVDLRSDVTVGVALLVAVATSGVGVAIAAACGVHAALCRQRPSRWIAVGVPSLVWLLWWRTLGDQPRAADGRSIASIVGEIFQGVFGSFGALTGGWWLGGVVLTAAWVALLAHRVSRDRVSALTQVAWAAGLLVWWAGLVWSRPGAADSNNTGRYEYVGAVLILLSALPAVSSEWLRVTTARWRMTAAALLIVGAIVVVNHDELRQAARNRAVNGARAEMVLLELEQAVQSVEPTRRLTPELGPLTMQDYYEKVVPRYGSPIGTDETPDEGLIERNALGVAIMGPEPKNAPACAAGPVTVELGAAVALHTMDEPATVRARRFGSSMLKVRTVPAHRSAIVRFPGPTVVAVPWVIDAPGACIHEG
jgi:hypothetical protein